MIADQIITYAFILIGLICIGCVPIVRKIWPERISKWFILLLVTSGLWCFSTTLQIFSSPTLKPIIYVISLCIGFTTIFWWWIFSLEYSGKEYHKLNSFKLGISIIILLVISMKLTNFHHGLYFSSTIENQPFIHLYADKQPVYYFTLALSYIISSYGFYTIYKTLRQSDFNTFKHKLCLLPLFIPFVMEILSIIYTNYLVLTLPYEPLGVALFSLGFIIASSEEIKPADNIGKNQLLNNIDIPILVTDIENNITYSNDSLKEVLNDSLYSEEDIIKEYNLCDYDKISVPIDDTKRYFNIDKDPICIGSRKIGYSYIMIDITDIVIKNKILDKQNEQNKSISDACRHHLRNQAMLIKAHTPDNNDQIQKSVDKIFDIAKNLPDIIDYSKPIEEKEKVQVKNIIDDIETDIKIHFNGKLTVTANKQKLTSLFSNCIKYADINSSENIYISRSDSTLNLIFDNANNFNYEIIDSVKEHGEIESNWICLNKIYSISESLFWDINYKRHNDKFILQFKNTNNNIEKDNYTYDFDLDNILEQ